MGKRDVMNAGRATFFLVAAALLSACGAAQPPFSPLNLTSPQQALVDPKAGHRIYKSIYRFTGMPDGSTPMGRLIPIGKTLYGTTYAGGRGCDGLGCGVVFAITSTGNERVVYRFGGGSDGAQPMTEVTPFGKLLYGTTYAGGKGCPRSVGISGCGIIYSVDTFGKERVLHHFTGTPDGAHPDGALIAVGSRLYGTTLFGGSSCTAYDEGCGTFFSIDPNGHETVLYRFRGEPDGSAPNGNLVNVKGALYGTTSGGGSNRLGTIFVTNLQGRERVVYSSSSPEDMYSPYGLVELGGRFYGSSVYGGTSGNGTVYAVSPDGTEGVIHDFASSRIRNGFAPFNRLIGVNGELYGTTASGGYAAACNYEGCGVVFSMTPKGKETVLHRFRGAQDGDGPVGGVTDLFGSLYGTTSYGGTFGGSPCPYGCGTVFRFSPPQ